MYLAFKVPYLHGIEVSCSSSLRRNYADVYNSSFLLFQVGGSQKCPHLGEIQGCTISAIPFPGINLKGELRISNWLRQVPVNSDLNKKAEILPNEIGVSKKIVLGI